MSFTAAYYDLLRDVMVDPEHVSKPRGLEVREKLCYKFVLNNPLDRLPYLKDSPEGLAVLLDIASRGEALRQESTNTARVD